MNKSPTNSRWLVWLLATGTVLGSAVATGVYWWPRPQPDLPKNFPIPPYSKSQFLNTRPEAQYIGTSACAACHRGNHQSYLQTAHSRALSDVDPDTEPPDASFEHKPSGRSYRVYRKNKQMRHEEVVRSDDGKEIARIDLPVRYLVGSGNFSRTYIVEIDGFLHESPITWYASKKKWDMSPGYDTPRHFGFERAITLSCMSCHAGQVAEVGESVHRLSFAEKAIGCENCHGPGSLHQDFHRSKKTLAAGEDDLTIVNPRRLSRSLQEDICATCHLTGITPVLLRGRSVTDFRPGMPLSDYRIHYQPDDEHDQMTVVGHVEQMRMSACHKKSEMTCLTCHDPHQRTTSKDSTAFYRKKCLTCHESGGCKLDPAERTRKDKTDNCIACHMPRGDTDIAHIAFTHHRIGLHSKQKPAERTRMPKLVPMESVGHLTDLDQRRSLGIAMMEASLSSSFPESIRSAFRENAKPLLDGVYAEGMRDAETLRLLTDLYTSTDRQRAGTFATQSLELKDSPLHTRVSALMWLSNRDMQDGEVHSAIARLQDVNRRTNSSAGWRFLAICHLQQNQPAKALAALEKALALKPYSAATQATLAETYRQLDRPDLAQEHRDKAQTLMKLGHD